MNQPDRYSRFVLPSGVQHAVGYQQDTKMKAAGQFDIWLEDHTVGNLVRQQLLGNPEVVFAGYRIPHPLNPMMVVRIQTTEHSNPPEAMSTAVQQLKSEVDIIRAQLQQCAPRDLHPEDPMQQQQQFGGPGYGEQFGGPAVGYGVPGYGAPSGGYTPAGSTGGGGYQY